MSCEAGHDWEVIIEAVSALPVRIMCGECGRSGAVSFGRRNLRMRYQVIVTIEDEDDKVFTFETDHAILGSSVEELPPDE